VSIAAKRYLGDGVYVDANEFGLMLTTENGLRVTNTIVLEPEVYAALERYVNELQDGPAHPPVEGL
jgi:hypothetical protein